jgi:histidine triad (HIT) family protein
LRKEGKEMAEPTLFDKIVDGSIPSWKVWEDDNYLAFLTPFPSTPGATVVVPKKNPGAYVFDLDAETVSGLMDAAQKTAKLLEKALGVSRVAAVFEGQEVPHLHIKLYPMHEGADPGKHAHFENFSPVYPGYINTANGPKAADEELTALQKKIQEAAKA